MKSRLTKIPAPAAPQFCLKNSGQVTELLSAADANFKKDFSVLNAKERMELSKLMAHWSDLAAFSAVGMNPKLAMPKTVPMVSKGFFLVNVAQWQQENLRALAHECGISLRDALKGLIYDLERDLRERAELLRATGLDAPTACQLIRGNQSN